MMERKKEKQTGGGTDDLSGYPLLRCGSRRMVYQERS